ncbi:MAG: 4-hydroxy-tetrahydrodipicolinate synthase [Chlamydiae bacterium]|nr:4-hydroxy-tetrahydrodipicolinate synthase [Chlamydiota bacterium]
MNTQLNNILWTALITPLDHHGQVDNESLMNLIKLQEKSGNGILLLGSTGEGLAISDDEKRRVIDFVCSQDIKVPLMVGVGGHQISQQLSWIQFCQKFPVDAFLLVTPYYSRPGYCGQMKWFTQLLDTSEKPCMLYNIPKRAGCSLEVDVVKDLQAHPNYFALKEASGSIEEFRKYKEVSDKKPLYSGNDNMMWDLACEGAQGLVGVMSNLWPRATRYFVEQCLKKERSQIVEEGLKASEVANIQNPLASKVGLFKKKLINSPNTELPLCPQDFHDTERLLKADQKMSQWEQSTISAVN